MKISSAITLVLITAIFLQGCIKEESNTGISDTTSQVSKEPSPIPKPFIPKSQHGAYELAEVLAWSMPDTAPSDSPLALPSFQDYNRFKGVVSNIQSSTSVDGGYEGTIEMLADGKRVVVENIEDDYKWKVLITGPNVGANSVTFMADRAVGMGIDIGASYLRRHQFDLVALSCFSAGQTSTNAQALYLARYPGKNPVLLSYMVSTGSAGMFVHYQVHFDSLEWESVPGAREVDYEGKSQPFGVCPYEDLM